MGAASCRARRPGMRLLCSLTILLLLLGASVSPTGGQDPATETARTEFFEARIRPVLVEHCYACHNSGKRARGGLALDHRAATREESNSGTAVVPGLPLHMLFTLEEGQ